jgi:hypothetical protein
MRGKMSDEFDYKFELLKLEIQSIQEGIKTYDVILLTIKGWAITIFSAFLIFTAQAKQPLYLVFCLVSILLFWLVDTTFKIVQWIYRRRYQGIERFLQGQDFSNAINKRSFGDFEVPNLDRGFYVLSLSWRLVAYAAITPNTSILYIAMTILTIALYVGMIVWKM